MILLGRMVFVALVIGTSLSAAATERVDLSLVLSTTISWSFVPVLQLLTGLLLVRGAVPGTRRALEAYFAAGWPWLLWILFVHGAYFMAPPARDLSVWLLATAVVPVTLTVILLLRLCRGPFGMATGMARQRVLIHQTATLALILIYVGFATASWPRLVGLVR